MLDIELHRRALRTIVALGTEFSSAVNMVQGSGFDGRQDVVTMTAEDARSVLSRALNNELSYDQLTSWADAIEGREDIQYEPKYADALSNLLFELSNPEINRVTRDSIQGWVVLLS